MSVSGVSVSGTNKSIEEYTSQYIETINSAMDKIQTENPELEELDLDNKDLFKDFQFLDNNIAEELEYSIKSKYEKDLELKINYEEIETDGYTAQGYTIVEDENGNQKVFISAYSKEDKSRLYVYDVESGQLEGKIILDSSAHVGGITYDYEKGIIWVTGEYGTASAYNYKKIMECLNEAGGDLGTPVFDMNDKKYADNLESLGIKIKNDVDVFIAANIPNPDDLIAAGISSAAGFLHLQEGMDSIYFYDGDLYSCTYSATGELYKSELEYVYENGEIVEIKQKGMPEKVGSLNGAVQGIAFYEEDGKTYMISASSAYGSKKSRLTKWEVTDNGLNPVGYIYIDHPGLEGIEIREIDGKKEITGVYEYNEKEVEPIGTTDDFSTERQPLTDAYFHISGEGWDDLHGYY